MTNPLENVYENANTLALGGVGTFAKEKKLELLWINSAKKQRRESVTVSDRMQDLMLNLHVQLCSAVKA